MLVSLPAGGRPLEETRRISRVLQIIQMIACRPNRYLRRDFAECFEVSERMIQKDFDLIRNGLKLGLLRSSSGYRFESVPRLPALRCSFNEALALLLAVQAAWQIPGVSTGDLMAAVARLKSLFPAEFAPLLTAVETRRPLTARSEHRQTMLTLLNHAILVGQKVRITYETRSRGGDLSERVIRPYHIKLHVRSWHVIGFCERRSAIRVFKVDRIKEAALTADPYTVPTDFDPGDYMGGAWGMIRTEGTDPVDVELLFEPEAGHWVSEEHWHSSQESVEMEDGSILFRLKVVPTPEFVNWLLYYGRRVRVLKPQALRERLAEEHRKAAEANES